MEQCKKTGGALRRLTLAVLWRRRGASLLLIAVAALGVFASTALHSLSARQEAAMAELEQTLYLNLKQMVCIRMLEAGILDLVILYILTGLTGRFNSAGTGAYLLYMLVPFLWSDVLYLHMLTAFRNGLAGYRQISAGILCGLLALFPVMLEDAYEAAALPWWRAFGLAGALLLGAEIYGILGKIEGGDSLCLN